MLFVAAATEFEGDFEANEAVKGTITFFTNGAAKYVGEVQQHVPHGYGEMFSSKGSRSYIGEWRHGQRHGHGVSMHDSDDGVV